MAEFLLDCLRDDVALRLDCGEQVAKLDDELIDGAPGLSEDDRAALWLFAWPYRPRGRSEADRLTGSVAG